MILAVILCFAACIGAYVYARLTHHVVHLQNRAGGTPTVVAVSDPWDGLLMDMAKDRPLAKAHARGQKTFPTVLNSVFWPLRKAEAACWTLKKG